VRLLPRSGRCLRCTRTHPSRSKMTPRVRSRRSAMSCAERAILSPGGRTLDARVRAPRSEGGARARPTGPATKPFICASLTQRPRFLAQFGASHLHASGVRNLRFRDQ
jgi:hypothetical protein